MGHINFDKGNRNTKGKNGFYLALALCLVAVLGVATATFLNAFDRINTDDEGNSSPSRASFTTAATKPVEQKVTNIPDERTAAKTTTAAATTAATTKKPPADLFVLPLTNQVIRSYSGSKPVFSPTMNDWRVHNGVDFKGEINQPVKAVADGIISAVYSDKLWGGVVEIDHGYGIISRYCGVKAGTLKKNSSVNLGDVIGWLSNVPCESKDGPHLHLEIKVNDEYVNPVEAIGREVKYTAAASE